MSRAMFLTVFIFGSVGGVQAAELEALKARTLVGSWRAALEQAPAVPATPSARSLPASPASRGRLIYQRDGYDSRAQAQADLNQVEKALKASGRHVLRSEIVQKTSDQPAYGFRVEYPANEEDVKTYTSDETYATEGKAQAELNNFADGLPDLGCFVVLGRVLRKPSPSRAYYFQIDFFSGSIVVAP